MILVRKSLLVLLACVVSAGAQEKGVPESNGLRKGPSREGKVDPDHRRPSSKGFMAKYDKNGDRRVSFEEFGSVGRAASLEESGRRRLFNHLDKNVDGKITEGELPRSIPRPMRGHDLDKDGRITFEEFRRNSRVEGSSVDRIRAMFSKIDRNGDNVLTAADFGRRPVGPVPNVAEFTKLDLNKDGVLSFEEWRSGSRWQGFPVEELKKRFLKMDRNRNGTIEPGDREGVRGRDKSERKRPLAPKE